MKLKINKACDLSSISVLPPQSRRSSSIPAGPQQASQFRSQQSQQSFSQGFSSQHGIFSQISQTSLDEALTNDRRFSSQEQENSLKKPSCLPVISYKREESQLPVSRSSSNLVRKWSAAPVPDHKCKINEELQHRIGMMETSLTKFGMILDSVQSDVLQVKKGIKEESLGMEGMRQKLIVLDTSLQLMNKGQEDVKFSLEGSLKSVSEQLSKDRYQDKLQQIFSALSTLPKQTETFLYRLQKELCTTITKEIQACCFLLPWLIKIILKCPEMACSLKTPLNQKCPSITVLSPKCATVFGLPSVAKQTQVFSWDVLYAGSSWLIGVLKEEQCRVIIDSDEEIDGGFSCLLDVRETGIRSPIIGESKEDTARILRKARRQKRKYCNPIIIN
ncbi:hypothetical protein SADUNF_Sadunf14G0058600 [Salix dunnii]|uniref:Uncharacterized protein n=1 Tax=Salix dunnii TaxID=1413687 RepID=A0A835JEY4_9ROSI|nr:hypothetical protein SADUNF_Sadunf14G0058600 [Salix dunnii]